MKCHFALTSNWKTKHATLFVTLLSWTQTDFSLNIQTIKIQITEVVRKASTLFYSFKNGLFSVG
jgi:hypothetical protein